MRVGIFTYHFSDNYGALMQAYALRNFIGSMGHDAFFVPYHPSYVEEGGKLKVRKPLSKDNAKILYLKLVDVKERIFGNKAMKEGFDLFRSEKLGITTSGISVSSELDCIISTCDILVTGSDQVWRPSDHFGLDPAYYLGFPFPVSARRVSYAPSFGTDTLNSSVKDSVSKLLDEIDYISVREASGKDIVASLTGQVPEVVPDPTFLADSFDGILEEYPRADNDAYVFSYVLRSADGISSAAQTVADMLGSALLSPHNPHRRWKKIGSTVYPSPGQWLWLLKNSKYVVTNSFHGVALSVLLQKEFIYVPLQGEKSEFWAQS